MKKLFLICCILGLGEISLAQTTWGTSGSDIYNTNGGNVGVGTLTPSTLLELSQGGGTPGTNSDVLTLTSAGTFTGGPSLNTTVGVNFSLKQGGNSPWVYAAIRAGEDVSTGAIQGSLRFHTQSFSSGSVLTEKMRISSNGNVGIGTNNPTEKLSLEGSDVGIMSKGTVRSRLNFSTTSQAGWQIEVGETDGNQLTGDLGFTETGVSGGRLVLKKGGNVGIGTTNPTSKLSVNGKIQAKEVKVETSWSDFVFEPSYKLPDLKATEQFIKENRHLPEIPSAAEVEENGINLGEINAKLLQKIEELTLYLIEKDKQVTDLQERMKVVEGIKQKNKKSLSW